MQGCTYLTTVVSLFISRCCASLYPKLRYFLFLDDRDHFVTVAILLGDFNGHSYLWEGRNSNAKGK